VNPYTVTPSKSQHDSRGVYDTLYKTHGLNNSIAPISFMNGKDNIGRGSELSNPPVSAPAPALLLAAMADELEADRILFTGRRESNPLCVTEEPCYDDSFTPLGYRSTNRIRSVLR